MKSLKGILAAIAILILLVGAVFIYAKFIEPNMLTVRRFSLKTSAKVEPFKIVFFSDTHFGSLYDQNKIESIVKKINAEAPEIVIFGGDLIDAYYNDSEHLDLGYLSEQLSKITASYKKLAVWGNHDYGGGASRIYEQTMLDGGFELLKNSGVKFDDHNISVFGADDYLLGFPQLDDSFFTDESFNLLISHAPDMVDKLELSEIDSVLSGHSHGGQINLPFITKRFLPTGAQHYVNGLYELGGKSNTNLIVSRGIGLTQLPYRFMSPPEINVISISN